MHQQPRRSWWGRNWKWVVPVGGLGCVAVCGGFITLIFTAVVGMMKSSYPYEESLARVRADPSIRAALGSPIEPGMLVTGNIEVAGSSGDADIAYRVSGPNGAAVVFVIATKSGGVWEFKTLDVDIESTGERIDLAGPLGEHEHLAWHLADNGQQHV